MSLVSHGLNITVFFILITFLLFAPPNSCAEDVDDFINTIQIASNKISSFTSDFVQEKHLALFTEPVLFHGRLFVARPNRLRWEFSSPIESVLILNDNVGMRCDEKSKGSQFDLTNDPIMRSVAEQLWLWLGGDYKKLKDHFELQLSGEHTLVVTPLKKSISDYIESVTIQFEGSSKQPEIVEILEPGGDLTRITFTSYSANPPVTDSLFSKCTLHE